jgi:hypothetical protein
VDSKKCGPRGGRPERWQPCGSEHQDAVAGATAGIASDEKANKQNCGESEKHDDPIEATSTHKIVARQTKGEDNKKTNRGYIFFNLPPQEQRKVHAAPGGGRGRGWQKLTAPGHTHTKRKKSGAPL